MSAQVFAFARRAPSAPADWGQQELAEFYRVEGALVRAGVGLETCRGVSDEGDPWFAFCRADTGDVFVHIARIDGQYVVDGTALERPARGVDFTALIKQLVACYPSAPQPNRRGNVFVHPSALLIALVGAAFFQSHEAKAADADSKNEGRRSISLISTSAVPAVVGPAAWAQELAESGHFAAVLISAVLTLYGDTVAASPVADVEGMIGDAVGVALVALPEATTSPELAWAVHDPTELGAAAELDQHDAVMSSGPALQVGVTPLLEASGPELSVGIPEESSSTGGAEGVSLPPLAGAVVVEKSHFLSTVRFSSLQTDAAEALGALRVLSELLSKNLPAATDLPPNLRDLIARGDHLDYNAPPATVAPSPPEDLPSPLAASPTPVVPDLVEAPFKPYTLDDAIAQFIAKVGHVEMVVEGSQMVIYDPDILNPMTRDVNFTSVTFTFPDGSTVSLVGTAAEVHSVWGGLG